MKYVPVFLFVCTYLLMMVHLTVQLVPYDDPELILLVNGDVKKNGRSSTNRAVSTIDSPNDRILITKSSMDEPWQQFIITGPITVNLLGQLMLVSSKLDFSFRRFSPNYHFEHMKYPDSFRATLTQVSHDGWRAFLSAHENMNKVQMLLEFIPKHVKTTLQVLVFSKSDGMIRNYLPTVLSQIKRIGSECVKLTNDTHGKFSSVMNLLAEVISTTEVTRGLQETQLKTVEIQLNASEVMRENLAKVGETIQTHYNEAKEVAREARDRFSKALKDIPTGWKAVGLGLGKAIVGVISSVGNVLGRLGGGGGGRGGRGGHKGTSQSESVHQEASNSQSVTVGRLIAEQFENFAEKFSKFVRGMQSDEGVKALSFNPNDEFNFIKKMIETYQQTIESNTDSRIGHQVKDTIQEAVQTISESLDLSQKTYGLNTSLDQSLTDNIKGRIESSRRRLRSFIAADAISNPNTRVGPLVSQDSPPPSDSNEVYVAQLAQHRLTSAEKRYDTIFKELVNHQKQMAELMGKMARLNLERINYIEILQVLREALILLSKIREQWGQLVLFFAEVAARAEIALSGTLNTFIDQATQAGASDIAVQERFFYVELLKTQAVDIHKESYSLYIMARTYVDSSNAYIMERLAGLSKLLVVTDPNERQMLLQKMTHETQDIQEKVITLVSQRKQLYSQSVEQRRQELNTFLQSIGGPKTENNLIIQDGERILGL